MPERGLETLRVAVETAKTQLGSHVTSMCEVISGDLPQYVQKQIRKAFIDDVSFAEAKTDEDLAELKSRIAAFGETLANDILTQLTADMDDWWGQAVDASLASRTLEGNAAVWTKLQKISSRISTFITDEGMAAIEITYATPARFMEGQRGVFLPSLIEKYWTLLKALRDLETEYASADDAVRKSRQASRWDAL